jgi:hypothetical protein
VCSYPTSRYQSSTLRCCWGPESVRGRQHNSSPAAPLFRGTNEVERVPDLDHGWEVREAPERPGDGGAIPHPPVALIEAPGRRVGVEDPEDRPATPERPHRLDRCDEEDRPDATATLVGRHVDRVNLADGPVATETVPSTAKRSSPSPSLSWGSGSRPMRTVTTSTSPASRRHCPFSPGSPRPTPHAAIGSACGPADWTTRSPWSS